MMTLCNLLFTNIKQNNMKYLFYLLFPIITFAQEKAVLVTYKAIYNTELPTTKNGYLYISNDQKKSIYFTENIKKTGEEKGKDIDVTIKLSSGKRQFNYFNYENDTLITRDDILKESLLVKEKTPHFNWVLSDESKDIENGTLYKATCYFRGRNYIAWYSPTTPIKAGPWKFQGLPGLIYEIYDETRRYNWVLVQVAHSNFNFNSEELAYKEKETLSIEEYAQLKFNDSNSLDEKILSKLPRGAKIVNQKTFRTGFEIKFEWEEAK